jgi:hypothetical protein
VTKLLVVVVGFVVSIAFEMTSTAVPCRPDFASCGRPHPPPPPPPPPPAVTTIYQRAIPAPPPASFDRASLTRVLVGSAWTRLGSREQIRFVDPPSTGHFARPPTPNRDRSIRAVMIDLRRDRRTLVVAIDGELYTIAACQLPRIGARPVLTTCLEHRDAGGGFGGQGYGGFTSGGR